MLDGLLGYEPAVFPSSQIANHLIQAPIKTQSLSLLMCSGSDRQHECRLFQIQKEEEVCQPRIHYLTKTPAETRVN